MQPPAQYYSRMTAIRLPPGRCHAVSTLAAVCLLLAACAPAPVRTTLPARWTPSPNFDARRPNFVVIHHTSNNAIEPALATLTNPAREVSAHYVVERDGTVYQLVDERLRAWHAGRSRWGFDTDLNSASIGIELDNDGHEPYPEPQIVSLLALLADIQGRYRIPTANFLGHGDIAPSRKVDPSALFPWKRLAERGFGLWCDAGPFQPLVPVDVPTSLQALGYDVSNVDGAVRAFNRHFLGREDAGEVTPEALGVLDCLVRKAREPQE
jgi:N-acetylmuramoyl-L-alanine amidase